MKKTIIMVLSVFIFSLAVSTIYCQPVEEEEGANPLLRKAWSKMKRSSSLRTIQVTRLRGGENFKVNMRNIKNALEMAGISEAVFISINIKNKELFNMGKFSPSIVGKSSGGDGPKPKPKDIKFHMSSLKVKANFAMKKGGGDEPKPKPKDKIAGRTSVVQTTRAQLIFRNARGHVMASFNIGIRGLYLY